MNKSELNIITAKSEADKAISTLKGILIGINADKVIHPQEIEELRLWAVKHKKLINKNPFKEFMDVINTNLNTETISLGIIEDLYWLCQKYETHTYFYSGLTSDLQTLQGICHGLLSDSELSDSEIYRLEEWLISNEHLNSYYPYDEIRSLILSITSDHKIDNEEKLVLKAFINQFVNINNSEINNLLLDELSNIPINAICTSEPNIDFDGKTFCITGTLKRYPKSEIYHKIKILGGIVTENVSRQTDYLIVGDNGNKAWAYSCYGRKIEKAISFRKDGHTINIIHEFDFCDILDDL